MNYTQIWQPLTHPISDDAEIVHANQQYKISDDGSVHVDSNGRTFTVRIEDQHGQTVPSTIRTHEQSQTRNTTRVRQWDEDANSTDLEHAGAEEAAQKDVSVISAQMRSGSSIILETPPSEATFSGTTVGHPTHVLTGNHFDAVLTAEFSGRNNVLSCNAVDIPVEPIFLSDKAMRYSQRWDISEIVQKLVPNIPSTLPNNFKEFFEAFHSVVPMRVCIFVRDVCTEVLNSHRVTTRGHSLDLCTLQTNVLQNAAVIVLENEPHDPSMDDL